MGHQICEKHPEEGSAIVRGYPCQACKRDRNAKLEYLRMLTHGWRNPPSVYEEDRSETHG